MSIGLGEIAVIALIIALMLISFGIGIGIPLFLRRVFPDRKWLALTLSFFLAAGGHFYLKNSRGVFSFVSGLGIIIAFISGGMLGATPLLTALSFGFMSLCVMLYRLNKSNLGADNKIKTVTYPK